MPSQNYLSYLRRKLIERISRRGLTLSAATYRVLVPGKPDPQHHYHPHLKPAPTESKTDLLLVLDIAVKNRTPRLSHTPRDLFSQVRPGGVMLLDMAPASQKKLMALRSSLEEAGFHVDHVLYYGFFSMLVNLPLRLLGFRFTPQSRVWSLWNTLHRSLARMEARLHPYLHFVSGERVMLMARHVPLEEEPTHDLSIVIPAYNEEDRLPPYLEKIHTYMKNRKMDYEILVVDDGSRDRTREVASQSSGGKAVRALRLYRNFGKGGAVREGVRLSAGRRILIADADGATPIEELERLEERMELGRDIVIGSRYIPGSQVVVQQSILRRLLSRAGNLMIRTITGLGFRDTQCGFKLFQRTPGQYLFRHLENLRFGFDFEILMHARTEGFVTEEVPVRWYDQEGSKVRSVDSVRVLWELVDLRFGQFFRFGLVGVLNTGVDLAIHNALIFSFGVGDGLRQTLYNGLSFIVANVLSYVLNSGFAFTAHGAYIRFFAVSVVTLYISSVSYYSLATYFNPQQDLLMYNLLKISSVTISLFTNYFGYRLLVFKK